MVMGETVATSRLLVMCSELSHILSCGAQEWSVRTQTQARQNGKMDQPD